LDEFIYFSGRKSFGIDDRFCVRSRNGGSVGLRFFIRDGTLPAVGGLPVDFAVVGWTHYEWACFETFSGLLPIPMDEKQCGIIRSTDREKIKNGRNNFFFFFGAGGESISYLIIHCRFIVMLAGLGYRAGE
jgi:hypothetical protein